MTCSSATRNKFLFSILINFYTIFVTLVSKCDAVVNCTFTALPFGRFAIPPFSLKSHLQHKKAHNVSRFYPNRLTRCYLYHSPYAGLHAFWYFQSQSVSKSLFLHRPLGIIFVSISVSVDSLWKWYTHALFFFLFDVSETTVYLTLALELTGQMFCSFWWRIGAVHVFDCSALTSNVASPQTLAWGFTVQPINS